MSGGCGAKKCGQHNGTIRVGILRHGDHCCSRDDLPAGLDEYEGNRDERTCVRV